jgi:hypothetical protein
MDKRFQLLLYDSTGGSVEQTITQANLRGIPERVGGQVIDILNGRTQSQPWNAEIVDTNDYFTAMIADAGGRMVLLKRRADLQVSIDGGAYSTICSSRISSIIDHVSHYQVTFDDERMLERNYKVFQQLQATTYAEDNGTDGLYSAPNIIPPGLASNFAGLRPQIYVRPSCGVIGSTGNYELYAIDSLLATIGVYAHNLLTPYVVQTIDDDVKEDAVYDANSTSGNFNTLRAVVQSTSGEGIYEVAFITDNVVSGPIRAFGGDFTQLKRAKMNEARWLYAVIVSTGTFTAIDGMQLRMPTHEPTNQMPLLIGGNGGIHPFELVRDLYDEAGVRYSTTLTDLIDNKEYQTAWWRIQRPATLSRWLEDNIYQPYGVAPFIDNAGNVAPRSIRLPRTSDVSNDITTLPLLDETNVAWPHPSWHHEELVTRLRFEYDILKTIDHTALLRGDESWSDFGVDLIAPTEAEIVKDHDRIDDFGVHEMTVAFKGLHYRDTVVIPGIVGRTGYSRFGVDHWAAHVAQDVFQRFGDGATETAL